MPIHGLFPLQSWMNHIHTYLSREEVAKARYAALALPIFEAIGCVSVIGKICFKRREEGEQPLSLYQSLGEAALLAFNILFSPYHGFRKPLENYQLHQWAGLTLPVNQDRVLTQDILKKSPSTPPSLNRENNQLESVIEQDNSSVDSQPFLPQSSKIPPKDFSEPPVLSPQPVRLTNDPINENPISPPDGSVFSSSPSIPPTFKEKASPEGQKNLSTPPSPRSPFSADYAKQDLSISISPKKPSLVKQVVHVKPSIGAGIQNRIAELQKPKSYTSHVDSKEEIEQEKLKAQAPIHKQAVSTPEQTVKVFSLDKNDNRESFFTSSAVHSDHSTLEDDLLHQDEPESSSGHEDQLEFSNDPIQFQVLPDTIVDNLIDNCASKNLSDKQEKESPIPVSSEVSVNPLETALSSTISLKKIDSKFF